MSSWRESLTSIPGTVAQLINESASSLLHTSSSLGSTVGPLGSTGSGSEGDSEEGGPQGEYRALPIPASLVREQWRLIFTSDASIQDLQAAIAHCRDLVLLSDELSDERRWLVRHLVDLRYSLQELEEAQEQQSLAPDMVVMNAIRAVVGHHFVPHHPHHGKRSRLQAAARRNYCDHCTSIIWSVVQASYVCSDCGFLVHQKCIDGVKRVCAHVQVSERQHPIAEICPEVGLAAQGYKCAECETLLNLKNTWVEPRLCDYSGLYYCPHCNWNDSNFIPARIIHNWDFSPRRVSRTALQEIRLFLNKPLIRLEEDNPKLFVFVEKLCAVKKLRQNLVHMRHYLAACRIASELKLVDQQLGCRRHLAQSNEFYSLRISRRCCPMCLAQAYICEICSNNEVIFPFDDGCIKCEQCNSIYHRVCLTRKNMICPKCIRIQERRLQLDRMRSTEDDEVATDDEVAVAE
ncbi:hypothetical protein M5D96_005927 [Drosophila gunungcola]|uniref:Phorbol-ester/DAG-type domain-containing protein n=1 Tax=Drosophila gunungcola TaxID=103775 RepID=A0A9Q0BR86_9MUSC|nr:hypothetical protein M5D96_005927 [Drosophila gunungcola]